MPTYHAVMTRRYAYAEYGTKEKELYGQVADPYQLESKQKSPGYKDTITSLSRRLHGLEGCGAGGCRTEENRP
jgi:hypothetical protein